MPFYVSQLCRTLRTKLKKNSSESNKLHCRITNIIACMWHGFHFTLSYLWVRKSFPLFVRERGLLLSSREHLRPEHHQASGTSSGESWNREQNDASSSESSTSGLPVLPPPPLVPVPEGESSPTSVELAPPPGEVLVAEEVVVVVLLLLMLLMVVVSRLVDAMYRLVREFLWSRTKE